MQICKIYRYALVILVLTLLPIIGFVLATDYRNFTISEAGSMLGGSFKVDYHHTDTFNITLPDTGCSSQYTGVLGCVEEANTYHTTKYTCYYTTTSHHDGDSTTTYHYQNVTLGAPDNWSFSSTTNISNAPVACTPKAYDGLRVVPSISTNYLGESSTPTQTQGFHLCIGTNNRYYAGPMVTGQVQYTIEGFEDDPKADDSSYYSFFCDVCMADDNLSHDHRVCLSDEKICGGHAYISSYSSSDAYLCSLSPIGYYTADHMIAYKCYYDQIAPYEGQLDCLNTTTTYYPVYNDSTGYLDYPGLVDMIDGTNGTHYIDTTVSDLAVNGGRCPYGMYKTTIALDNVRVSFDPDNSNVKWVTHYIDYCKKCPLDNYCPDGLTYFACSESNRYQKYKGQYFCDICKMNISDCTGTMKKASAWIERGDNASIAPICHTSCCLKGQVAVGTPTNASSCIDTPAGYYTPDATNTYMCSISNGVYAPTTNMVKCLNCNSPYSPRSSSNGLAADMCVIVHTASNTSAICEEGQYLVPHPDVASAVRSGVREYYYNCQSCPPGYYCNGRTKTKCKSYDYQNLYGQSMCKKCPGSYLLCCGEGETTENNSCYECEVDYEYCCDDTQDETPENNGCYECELKDCCGSNQTPEINNCYDCVADGTMYVPSSDQTYCTFSYCRPGYYPGVVYGECIPCPIGYYCDGVDKLACNTGNEYQDETRRSICKECSDGYVPNTSRTSCVESSSIACNDDQFITNGHCETCPPGHYCEDYSLFSCPINTIRPDAETEATMENCVSCGENEVSNPERTMCISLLDPLQRDVADEEDEGDYFGSAWLGATNPGDPDSYEDEEEELLRLTTESLAANQAFWCDEGFYYAGSTSSSPDLDTNCQPCPAGYACPGWLSSPYQCSGTKQYQPDTQASSCMDCGADDMDPNEDNTGCWPSSCTSGYYIDEEYQQCLLCPIGYECSAGNQYECQDGFYSPSKGLTDCLQCPSDSTSNDDHTACVDTSIDPREGMPTFVYPFADAVSTDNTVLAGSFGIALLFVLYIGTMWYIKKLQAIVIGNERSRLDRDMVHQKMRRQFDRIDIREMQATRKQRQLLDRDVEMI